MRQRAKNFGGHMEVWSEGGAGPEVELTIPASIADGVAFHIRQISLRGQRRTPNS
jgi:hypothetical protein